MPTCSRPDERSQFDKFKALARELEADEDAERWDARLAKVVKHKPDQEQKDG